MKRAKCFHHLQCKVIDVEMKFFDLQSTNIFNLRGKEMAYARVTEDEESTANGCVSAVLTDILHHKYPAQQILFSTRT